METNKKNNENVVESNFLFNAISLRATLTHPKNRSLSIKHFTCHQSWEFAKDRSSSKLLVDLMLKGVEGDSKVVLRKLNSKAQLDLSRHPQNKIDFRDATCESPENLLVKLIVGGQNSLIASA